MIIIKPVLYVYLFMPFAWCVYTLRKCTDFLKKKYILQKK
jgi:hypothetical protein